MNWNEPRPKVAVWLLVVLVLACLVPFLDKAVHMDDPLFIWTAQHIQHHPLDFYGFMVDWDVRRFPMSQVMQNPPLASYYMAIVGTLLGWTDVALHFGFIFPALALILGTYVLASRFCSHPFAVALSVLAAPVFLISGTSLMCDTLMVAFWIWALVFWMKGIETSSHARLAAAAILIVACSLTKYFGIFLIPLLLVYSLAQKRRLGCWLIYLGLSVALLGAYQWWTTELYGHGLLFRAAVYAQSHHPGWWGSTTLTGLAFTGGCVFISLSAVPLMAGKRGVIFTIAGAGIIAALALGLLMSGLLPVIQPPGLRWLVLAQFGILGGGGCVVIWLAVQDLLRHRTPAALLLFLWTIGTFLFVTLINWTVSGRNILPLAPAACLLIIRRLEGQITADKPNPFRFLLWPLGISLAVALVVAWADWKLAAAGRKIAFAVTERFAVRTPLAFEGHWGFQYYFEKLGATALHVDHAPFSPDEVIVLPMNNTHRFLIPRAEAVQFDEYQVRIPHWISLINSSCGAGYYSDRWGMAPFIFGTGQNEEYLLLKPTGSNNIKGP